MKNNNHFLNIALVATVAFSLLATDVIAQAVAPTANIPVTVGANPAVQYPGIKNLVNTGKFNYARTILPDVPLLNLPSGNNYFRQGTEYFDGLGRPLQSVGRKSHSQGFDIVGVNVYDSMGRETYQYQPFAGPIGPLVFNGSYGTIKFNDSTQMRKFYEEAGRDEQPFNQIVFESSPLGRIIKSMPPGGGGVGSNKGTTYNYITNTNWSYNNGQNVYVLGGGFPIWTIANTAGALPVNSGQYLPGQLHITIVTDADGKSSMEVKDKQGKVMMKMVNLTPNAWGATRPSDYAYTIYIYDDLGRVRCVLPPEVAKPTGTTGTFTWPTVTQQMMDGLCFSNVYDYRGRVIEKKVPGKQVEYFVYDKRDRVVLSQDGNLRTKQKWQFTGFDAMDRPLWTGLYGIDGSPETRTALQSYMDDNQPYGDPSLFYYLKKYDMIDVSPLALNNCIFLSYTNYDHYGDDMSGFNASEFADMIPSNNVLAVPSSVTYIARGLPTKSSMRLLDSETGLSDKWVYKAIYYDAKARAIQTTETNIIGGSDVTSNVYYFQGALYKSKLKHHDTSAVAIPGTNDGIYNDYTIVNTYERNFGIGGKGNDLVKKHKQKINNGPEYELSAYEYDHLGRNTLKQWTAGLNLNEYNMGGSLNHIAFRNYQQDTVFNENLYFHKGFASKLYNGNIAGVTWWGKDHVKRAYGYTYDNLNRLTHAEFNQYNGGWNKTQGIDFTASNISYDLNGNLLTMNQMGRLPMASSSIPIDIMNYKYAPFSNQLFNVKDGVAPTVTAALPDFKDDGNNNANTIEEYHYDNNGNLIWDLNKKISSITYNYLNKPSKIIVDGKGSIGYTYDAAGNRIRKVLTDAVTSVVEKWDYIGDLVYKNNELQYILNEEGRARPIAAGHAEYDAVPDGDWQTKFVYDYFVKDHLGNVRSTVNSKPNAYPYLAMHNISTANIEELIFDNIQKVRDTKPGSSNPDDMAARLNGAELDKRIGTAIMLRTNPGDRFTINVNAFYDGDYGQDAPVSPNEMMESLMGTLLGGSTIGPKPLPLDKLPDNQALIRSIFADPSLAGQVDQILNRDNNKDAPKAHLNYLWFDDKMQVQPSFSGSVQVAQVPNDWNVISVVGSNNGITGTGIDPGVYAPGVGVLIVYIDNQSIGKDVWFDNLSLNMYTSEVTEEDHYYPFGLTVNTFTNVAVAKNPYKLSTKELESKFDINSYDFGARMQDMQLGRWWGIDPLAEHFVYESPYSFAGNNPVQNVDHGGSLVASFNAEQLQSQGVTQNQIKTFTTIVQNVGNMLNNNPAALEAIVKSTGFSADKILSDFKSGKGPIVELIGSGGSGATTSGFTIDADYFQYLSKLDPVTQSAEYNEQLLGIGLSFFHEYVHFGDQQMNGGKNSGQWLLKIEETSSGTSISNEKYTKVWGSEKNTDEGAQPWKVSLTGHRGSDVEAVGFGVTTSDRNAEPGKGKVDIEKITKYSKTIESKTNNLPTIPSELPDNVKGNNIRTTLGVK